jgi:hypothetical protein
MRAAIVGHRRIDRKAIRSSPVCAPPRRSMPQVADRAGLTLP